MIQKFQNGISRHLAKLIFIFLILQPIFDVFSYFLAEKTGNNTLSTLLRFAMLAAVALIGFLVSDKKKLYLIIYAVMAIFWILHVLNCFRIGYQSLYEDTSNYLRIISLPVYTLSFITFFTKGKDVRGSVYLGFAANFALCVLFTVIPWVFFEPVYTYERLNIGIMGWFSVKNAQSAILCLLTPLTIYFAYRTKKYLVFLSALLITFTLLFFTGTKLTFYTIFLAAAAFIVLFAWNLKLKAIQYAAPLLMLVAVCYVFRAEAPMNVRESQSDHATYVYDQMVKEVAASKEGGSLFQEEETEDEEEAITPERLRKERKSLQEIYTDRDVYGKIFADINARFGVYNVMDAYENTAVTTTLSDSRELKTTYAKLVWEEKDFLTKLLGFEYSEMLYNNKIYDLENDFPAVFYFCGYIGFGIYMLFFLYFVFIVVRRFLRRPKDFLTVEMGAVGMTFVLALGAAQISGNVLRRPNVTAYFAITAAALYHLCVNKLPEKLMKVQEKQEKESVKISRLRKN